MHRISGVQRRIRRGVRLALHLLSARQVQTASAGDHQDGGGLFLRASDKGASWVLRFTAPDGRRREMGLGPAERGSIASAGATLTQAREAAARARTRLTAGIDPIEQRKCDRAAAKGRLIAAKRSAEAERTTLARVARKYHEEVIEPQRTAKHAAQWIASLEQGVPGSIWHAPIDGIRPADLLEALAKLQGRVPETAARVRQRIEVVFDDAIFHELCKENPARTIRRKLAERPKGREKGNFAALPFPQLPEFFARLREQPGVASLALQFTALCAARTGEVLGATWDEFDSELNVWRVPAGRMKAGEEHTVYLSDAAKSVLRRMHAMRAGSYVFPSVRNPKKPLSNMAMLTVLRRMKMDAATTVHGLRSSFSTWANDTGAARPDVIEACLAHREADKVRAAYNRASFAAERKLLLALWADYCTGKACTAASASVLPFRDVLPQAA
jgi:integrase